LGSSYQLIFDGSAADDALQSAVASLEVEESSDLPGAIQLTVGVVATDHGDVQYVGDARFQPFVNLAVVVTPDGGSAECIFDGHLLSQKLHLERGTTNSSLVVSGEDASWLMNLEEKVREWANKTEGEVANAIFAEYGFATDSANTEQDSPSYTEDNHTLLQRSTDAQFLRGLALRGGKLFRVACGSQAGQRTGYFRAPKLDGDPSITLELADPESWTVDALDFTWDVAGRPTKVKARVASFTDSDEDGVGGETTDSGLAALDQRGLAEFAGRDTTALLTTAADDAGQLAQRSRAVLVDGGWFARCEGEADVSRLGGIPRVGQLIAVAGAGQLHSGNYLVWSVRHSIKPDSHRLRFTLVRNAVGPAAAPAGGLFGGIGP
jgi:hypothetical protein